MWFATTFASKLQRPLRDALIAAITWTSPITPRKHNSLGNRMTTPVAPLVLRPLAAVPVLAGLCLAATGHAYAHDGDDCRARSCWMAGVAGDFASAVDEDLIDAGGGGVLFAGLQRNVGQVALISELVLSHHVLDAQTSSNAAVTAAKFGGRLRFLKDFEPGLFVHVGGGRVSGDPLFASTDLAFDVGASLDLTLLPLVDLGTHVAWNRVFGGMGGGLSYVTVGIHAALVIKDSL